MATFYNSPVRLVLFVSLVACVCWAQRSTGELRLIVSDVEGSAVEASVHLAGRATHLDRRVLASRGRATLSLLPFGAYTLKVEKSGFAPSEHLIEINSEVPREIRIALQVSPVQSVITVSEDDTLLNRERPGLVQYIGKDLLDHRRSSLPARGVLDMIDTQPGWLLEANGVLHPRGSEYDMQYVVDGIPLFDNRSPAFAPALGVNAVESMNVLTGGYPAEYGRKLGGVVEVATLRDPQPDWHGQAGLQGGSFDTRMAFANLQYGKGRTSFGFAGDGIYTDRYLDPPVMPNYTNHGSGGGFGGRFETNLSEKDRLRLSVRHKRVGFLVPNDYLQEEAGQRQDRTTAETLGQISWQRTLSPSALLNVRAMTRDLDASLWSNTFSTPIRPEQNRGFREAYFNSTLSVNRGSHEMKFGFEAITGSIRETFAYQITAYEIDDFEVFDDDLPPSFNFRDRVRSKEFSTFAQDQWRWKNLVVNFGLRWDYYSLRVTENAVSPRVAAAWNFPSIGLIVRGSYDRVSQTPAVENILLASSDAPLAAGEDAFRLPVRPSRGNFYEGGLSKTIFGKLRLDASIFRRNLRNFADDEVFFNTGVSFPIAFDRANIDGVEAKLEMPRWSRFTGYLSYSNLNARASLPIVGGLFLEEEAEEQLESHAAFRITQDQRNTIRSRWRADVTRRFWLGAGAQYGSGLPVELEDDNRELWEKQYGEEILNRVNFSRERVRPNFSLDFSAGAQLIDRERLRLTLQVDAVNVTDRLNVINFAGLLSGTAIQPQRSYAVRLETIF